MVDFSKTVPMISTVAGNVTAGYSGDGGPATDAQMNLSGGVFVDDDSCGQRLYIADSANHRIRMVDPYGRISTFAGTSAHWFSGDGGLATQATLASPFGIAVLGDGDDNIIFVDSGNHRLREVTPGGQTLSFPPVHPSAPPPKPLGLQLKPPPEFL